MSYKALYRTYRPQAFDEVAGQQHVIKTLKNALEKNKIAHAYLFCGPRGTGKTTMAKIFAKALNCEEGIGHQCNKCSNCVEITNGSHPDVIEIDAASNNGVEQARSLIEQVNYMPIKGKYKVFIIDEVHAMTDNAFNALLKTLEEPPAHVVFILATTEPHNIIPTVLSRCQRYDFTKVSDKDIFERIKIILDSENVQYEEEAINAIISLADGGVRDALSLLEQVLSYSGDKLTVENVYKMYGLASIEEKVQFIKNINNGNVLECIDKIKEFSEAGIEFKRLTNDLLDILKDVLIAKKIKDYSKLTVIDENSAKDLANSLDIKTINTMIAAFLNAEIDYKSINNIRTMFEVLILRLATSKDQTQEPIIQPAPVSEVKPAPQPQVKVEPKVEPVVETPTVVEPVPAVNTTPVVKEHKPEPIKEEKKEDTPPDWLFEETPKADVIQEGEKYELDDDTIIKIMVQGNKEERISLVNKWSDLNKYSGHPTYGEVIALLNDGSPFILSKNVLVLAFNLEKTASKFNIKSNADAASKIISKFIGREVFVYALTRPETIRLRNAYLNKSQISQLPKIGDINITLEDLRK